LGVLEQFVNSDPDRTPEPKTVGYVGNLGHRVDWALVDAVAETCSDLRFRFAGELEEGADPDGNVDWERRRAHALERSNVEHLGRIPQDDVVEVYWTSAVNWIPYDAAHPFNEASCPTKIMDALASGRSLVSTPVASCIRNGLTWPTQPTPCQRSFAERSSPLDLILHERRCGLQRNTPGSIGRTSCVEYYGRRSLFRTHSL
jgi:hypothetical protein